MERISVAEILKNVKKSFIASTLKLSFSIGVSGKQCLITKIKTIGCRGKNSHCRNTQNINKVEFHCIHAEILMLLVYLDILRTFFTHFCLSKKCKLNCYLLKIAFLAGGSKDVSVVVEKSPSHCQHFQKCKKVAFALN